MLGGTAGPDSGSQPGYYINPLVNVVLGVLFLHERLNLRQWLAVGIAAVGVLALVIGQGVAAVDRPDSGAQLWRLRDAAEKGRPQSGAGTGGGDIVAGSGRVAVSGSAGRRRTGGELMDRPMRCCCSLVRSRSRHY